MSIQKALLEDLYITKMLSSAEIGKRLRCSESKINYWIKKHRIQKRTISDAVYRRRNPNGDPFMFTKPSTMENAFLFGLGIGLYWGEGTKSNKSTIRLGNTDPQLIKAFLLFLKKIYNIDTSKLRFGLQIFNDMNSQQAFAFWKNHLQVSSSQFQKVIVTPARSIGTYRQKTKYGVLTIYYCNKKLRDILCKNIQEVKMPM